MLTQKDNLIIMPYMNIMFMFELKNSGFFESDEYKKMKIQDNNIREVIDTVGIDNQGLLLMTLYAILVVPKELYIDESSSEYICLNNKVKSITIYERSNYRSDSNGINYIRHIRNSISHARVVFFPNQFVEFIDENTFRGNNERCVIRIPLAKINELLEELQKVFYKYIEDLKSNSI